MSNIEPKGDPYAPPPRYREKGGPVVIGIALLVIAGLAVWGYFAFLAPQT